MARAFYSSAYLCVQPFPPRYGQMEAKRAAAERLCVPCVRACMRALLAFEFG